MDVFGGWTDYVDRIKNNWSRIVTENDTVVIPGDISWALKLNDTAADFAFIDDLPGNKILLKGNHDLWWSTLTKVRAFLKEKDIKSIDFVFNNAVIAGDYAVCGTRGWFFDAKESEKKIVLREAARLDTSITAAKQSGKIPLVFLHYPVFCNGQICEEIFEVIKKHDIKELWHGHLHGSGKQPLKTLYDGVKMHLISCDCVDFSPVLIK